MRNKTGSHPLCTINWMKILWQLWLKVLVIPVGMANAEGFRSFVQVEMKLVTTDTRKSTWNTHWRKYNLESIFLSQSHLLEQKL